MRVGLIDYDFLERPKRKILNVELMKIANYYEEHGHEVYALTPQDNIFAYDKLIIGSTVIGNLRKIKNIELHPNKEYIGMAFNNWNFVPTGIEEIDYGKINLTCYNNLINYGKNYLGIKKIEDFYNRKWIRLFPNEKPIELKNILTGEKFNIVDTYIFDKDNWEELLLKMSIYYKYYRFVYPQIVKNTNDLNNFIKMLNYKFINLTCIIMINDYEEFCSFCLENKEKLNRYATRIRYVIGFDKTNIYSENFYLNDIINTLKKITFLNDKGIIVKRTAMQIDYSKFFFTSSMFNVLKIYFKTSYNNSQTFHQCALSLNRKRTEFIKHYYHFMNTKQQYYYLFSRKFSRRI